MNTKLRNANFFDCCVDDEGLFVQPIARVESGDISAVGSS